MRTGGEHRGREMRSGGDAARGRTSLTGPQEVQSEAHFEWFRQLDNFDREHEHGRIEGPWFTMSSEELKRLIFRRRNRLRQLARQGLGDGGGRRRPWMRVPASLDWWLIAGLIAVIFSAPYFGSSGEVFDQFLGNARRPAVMLGHLLFATAIGWICARKLNFSHWLSAGLTAAAVAGAAEIAQIWIPSRTFDGGDLFLNATAAFLFALVAWREEI